MSSSSQQHRHDQEEEQQLYSGIVKPLPMHIHKHVGLCPPPPSERGSYGLSAAGDSGWFDRASFPSDSGPCPKQLIPSTTSTSYSSGSANGNLHYAAQDQSHLVQGFIPFNGGNVNSAGSVEPYHHPYGPSPAHVHHPVQQPWTPAFFMLPKTTYEPYGLPGYSYGPNYYQAPISFNAAGPGTCACPATSQYGCYSHPSSPNSAERLLGHQPLNLSDSRFLHSIRPPHLHQQQQQPIGNNSSYGDQMLSHHGYVGLEFQPDFDDQREDEQLDLDDQIAIESPELVDDHIDSPTVPKPKTTTVDGVDVTAAIDVTEYEADIVKVASAVLLNSADDDSKPKRKRGRPPKKTVGLVPEVVNYCGSANQVIGPVDPDQESSGLENVDHQPPPIKMVKLEAVDIKPVVCNPDEPIVRTPDSSDAMKPIKSETKKIRRQQSASGAKVQLSQEQMKSLELKFQENPFLSDVKDRIKFADMINLSERRIAIWFQNRRTKERRNGRMPAGPLPEDYAHHHLS